MRVIMGIMKSAHGVYRKKISMRGIFALIVVAGLNTAAQAEDCKPLKLLNKIQMVADPTGGWGVPVTINGQEKVMSLGLGAATSHVSRDAITTLKLPTRKSNVIVKDLDGNTSTEVAKVSDLRFGYMDAKESWLTENPYPKFGADTGWVGTLGRDMLFGYDVDIDFGTGILSLFGQDHCPDRVGYWVEPPPGAPLLIKDWNVTFQVSLDGQPIRAELAFGNHSIMTQDRAEHLFGLSPAPGELIPVPESTSVPPIMGYYHTFSNLTFGGVSVKNLQVLIVQDVLNRGVSRQQSTGNRAYNEDPGFKIPDLAIGSNVAKHLHINIAPRKGMLFVSGASAPPAK